MSGSTSPVGSSIGPTPAPSANVAAALQLAQAGRVAEAVEHLRAAAAASPADAQAWGFLGALLLQQAQPAAALDALARAVQLRPDWADARSQLAYALASIGRTPEAVAHWREAFRLSPDAPGAAASLVVAAMQAGDYAELARVVLDTAERMRDPSDVVARFALDVMYAGRAGAAVAAVREAIRRAGPSLKLRQALALPILYWEGTTPEEIHRELSALGQSLAATYPPDPRGPARRVPRDPGTERLRVGYLSQDFRSKAAGHFIEPVLANHDRTRFEIYCYSTSVSPPDDLAARLRPHAAKWTDIPYGSGILDGPVAELVRADELDVLVDLVGHPPLNGMVAFARRVAPVQVTYLGYPATTGLPSMDARLIDSTTDPAGHERYATERLVRLDPCFLCYAPPPHAPPVSPAPARTAGVVTFGSFNTAAKIEPSVVRLWSRILHTVPGSRLLLKNRALGSASVQWRYRDLFAAEGVVAARLVLIGETPGKAEHLATYAHVDIALDPFPYQGTTTTCEALWMGVPVVTMAGDRHAWRVGASLCRAVGVPELVAADLDGYARLAATLAADLPRLERYRAELRTMMAASPLCDGPGFTRRLEAAYVELARTARART